MQTYISCPSCNAFYKVSDFKEDKIKCSKCGREIGKDSKLIIKNEREEVEKFLKSEECLRITLRMGGSAKNIIGLILAVIIIWGGTGYGVYYYYSNDLAFPWWLWASIFVTITSPFSWRYLEKGGTDFVKFVKENDYSLVKMYKNQSGVEHEFFNIMVDYIKSQNEIKEDYSITGGGMKLEAQPTIQRTSETLQRQFEYYITPPDQCPSCSNFYTADEKENESIKCKKCGYTIKIANPVSKNEISKKLRKYIITIPFVKIELQTAAMFLVLFAIDLYIVYTHYISLNGLYELVVSPYIIAVSLLLYFGYNIVLFFIIKPLKYFKLSRKNDLSLFEFEQILMIDKYSYRLNPHALDTFYSFKKEINNMFIRANKTEHKTN